jgi:adenylate cyclase
VSRSKTEGRLLLFTAGFLLAVAAAVLAIFPPPLVAHLDGKIYDLWLTSHPGSPDAGVVVADVDERSLAVVGQWPWPRYRVARLLTALRDLGAASVAIDITLAEPDRTSLAAIRRDLMRDFGAATVDGLPAAVPDDNDAILAAALAEGPFILGYQFLFDAHQAAGTGRCALPPLQGGILDRGGRLNLFTARGPVCPLEPFIQAAGRAGFVNVIADSDGMLRRVPLVIGWEGRLYPSLALATVLDRQRIAGAVIETGATGIEALRLGDRRVPLDPQGNLLVNYRGRRGSYRYISAVDLLDGRVPRDAVDGRVVVLGVSGAGLLELHATPFDAAHPGPEINATVIDTLLSGDFVRRPPWARLAEVITTLALALGATFLLARAGALWGIVVTIAAAAALWSGSLGLFSATRVYLSPLPSSIALAGEFALLTVLRIRQAERAVRDRTVRLAAAQDAIIQSLAALAETRDSETGGHIQRTRHYVRALALRLRRHPRFRDLLNDETVELLFRLAPLHDIGKVGVRDAVLLKAGQLTPEEFEEMKRHTSLGSAAIKTAKKVLGEDTFLQFADDFALSHQEKWDGSGYPQGLRGKEIPLAARLMAVADVYDALTSRRVYKEPFRHEEAVYRMRQGRGTDFDPDILDAFVSIQGEFQAIAARFGGEGVAPDTEDRG